MSKKRPLPEPQTPRTTPKRHDHLSAEHLADLGNGKPKECWNNAFTSILVAGSLGLGTGRDWRYCEGYLVTEFLIIEHGFILAEGDSIVIDPTLTKRPYPASHYFAGLTLSPKECWALAKRRKEFELPVIGSYYGWRFKPYFIANLAASEYQIPGFLETFAPQMRQWTPDDIAQARKMLGERRPISRPLVVRERARKESR